MANLIGLLALLVSALPVKVTIAMGSKITLGNLQVATDTPDNGPFRYSDPALSGRIVVMPTLPALQYQQTQKAKLFSGSGVAVNGEARL